MAKPVHDLEKLPKWARDEILRLRRDLEHAHGKLREGPEDSRVFADPYSSSPRPLGHDPSIQFGTERGSKITVHFNKSGGLDITADTTRIVVRPRASNAIEVAPS